MIGVRSRALIHATETRLSYVSQSFEWSDYQFCVREQLLRRPRELREAETDIEFANIPRESQDTRNDHASIICLHLAAF
jgi:hypothetical protein